MAITSRATGLSLTEKQVLDYLKSNAGVWFERYDPRLQQVFPGMKVKSLGWYLWMLEKKGFIDKLREGRRVKFAYLPVPTGVARQMAGVVKGAYGDGAQRFTFTVHLERDEDGFVVASCPALPGCHTQGKTREEALANIREAIQGYLASMRRHGEEVPKEEVAQVEVMA